MENEQNVQQGKEKFGNVRVGKEYKEKLKKLATAHKRSLSNEVEYLIDEAYKKEAVI